MKLAASLLLAVLALSGCAGTMGVSYDRQTIQPLDMNAMRGEPRCSLRLCVNEPRYTGFTGSVQGAHLGNLEPFFASVVLTQTPGPDECDLSLKHESPLRDYADVFSAYTGQFLANFKVPNWALGGSVCKIFGEDGEGFAKIPGSAVLARGTGGAAFATGAPARAPAPVRLMGKGGMGGVAGGLSASAPMRPAAAAPAPAQGLSAADIERIAKAVRGAETPAAPAGAPPASVAPNFSAAERPNDLAIIVGIESYSDIASKASYAERDASALKDYVRALGVPERNIVLLTGSKAVRSALTKNVEGWLPRMAKADSRVYFYFSGHGAPDVKTGQAYLVPWDGDPNFLDATAYPVAQLYKKLGELPAKQVLVAMDSCFSGAGGRSVLASGARPLVGKIETGAPTGKLTVLAASASNEISGSLDAQGHGAFTYFLLEGLNAGKTTPKALNEYLTPRVQDEARRLNRDQTPQLQGDGAWSLR